MELSPAEVGDAEDALSGVEALLNAKFPSYGARSRVLMPLRLESMHQELRRRLASVERGESKRAQRKRKKKKKKKAKRATKRKARKQAAAAAKVPIREDGVRVERFAADDGGTKGPQPSRRKQLLKSFSPTVVVRHKNVEVNTFHIEDPEAPVSMKRSATSVIDDMMARSALHKKLVFQAPVRVDSRPPQSLTNLVQHELMRARQEKKFPPVESPQNIAYDAFHRVLLPVLAHGIRCI